MVSNLKKKHSSGEAAHYVTRKQALKKLQLSLRDFRRLCILKGIHPREPKNRKRAQKGNMTVIQTLYYEKDIRFLMHEPLMNKFRDMKVIVKKISRAKRSGNYERADRLHGHKPSYSLDHIVLERYPSFIDAIRDLEDCLCLCFLYATFPKTSQTPVDMISLCRRLTIEFMHYVIESKSLRKVFVSIKGYYYQAEILGQIITWIVPHRFPFDPPTHVDMALMSIFVEFYTTMLGFVNFRLFHKLGLCYPPSIRSSSDDEERITSLNKPLARNRDEEVDEIPLEPTLFMNNDDEEKTAGLLNEALAIKKLQSLFHGLKIFLNREVPRESLVFMIRSCGGSSVAWEGFSDDIGSCVDFNEGSAEVTHQICDRPRDSISMNHVNRYYVQPQWIFDCINQRILLPVTEYLVGELLPPHLSPFVDGERRIGDYIPPEERKLMGESLEHKVVDDAISDLSDDQDELPLDVMGVSQGIFDKIDEEKVRLEKEKEEHRLREMMIPKKHKGLYRSMMKSRRRRIKASKTLERKRRVNDAQKALSVS